VIMAGCNRAVVVFVAPMADSAGDISVAQIPFFKPAIMFLNLYLGINMPLFGQFEC